MTDITLRFRQNAKSGKRELIVHYESDDDVLAHEHEKDHRAFIEDLIGESLDDTDVVFERVAKGAQAEAQSVDAAATKTAAKKTQG